MSAQEVNPRCYMDFKQGDKYLGRVIIELFADVVPKTAANFIALCNGNQRNERGLRLYYKRSIVHRVIQSFMIQMGDFTNGDGTGGYSLYGEKFEDENLEIKHQKYYLSMANAGRNTNGSQFFICTDDCAHLNGKHCVFGKVVDGMDVIDTIENVETDAKDKPVEDIRVSKCGQLVRMKQSEMVQHEEEKQPTSAHDKIDEDEEEDESESGSESASVSVSTHSDEDDDANMERKKKKRKREFHLDSVNYVDRNGRRIKGKGKFHCLPEKVICGRRRGYNTNNNRMQSRYHRDDDWNRERFNKYQEDKHEEIKDDKIVFSENVEFGTIENDQNTVSSTVCIYSVEELCRQDQTKHRMSKSRSRSRSRSRHRHHK